METFLNKLVQLELGEESLAVGDWMTTQFISVDEKTTIEEALQLQQKLIIVVDEKRQFIGVMNDASLRDAYEQCIESSAPVKNIARRDGIQTVGEDMTLPQLLHTAEMIDLYVVQNEVGEVLGLLTKETVVKHIIRMLENDLHDERMSAILSVILEKAYEGIAVVDENGYLIEFNEAYSNFTGVPREEALGRHVTEVIENTNLHETVQKGMPERGVIQNIQGQDMIVHRIPIWHNGKVVAAIGMLIFEGVSQVYRIYESLQLQNVKMSQKQELHTEKEMASLEEIVGVSKEIFQLKRLARKAARTKVPVFLTGESGTGKKAFGEGIHQLSSRRDEVFIAFDCRSYEPERVKQMLFRRIQEADGGTLFLENIDVLPADTQYELLEFLEEGKGNVLVDQQIDVRLIVASSTTVDELLHSKQFDRRLFETLSIVHLDIPPLRNRQEDIPILLAHYMQQLCMKHRVPEKTFTSEVVQALMNYEWPGNVRELVNSIERVITLSDDEMIQVEDLDWLLTEKKEQVSTHVDNVSVNLEQFKEKQGENERELIISLLKKTGGNKSKTAELLGIHRTTLYKKLKKYNIDA